MRHHQRRPSRTVASRTVTSRTVTSIALTAAALAMAVPAAHADSHADRIGGADRVETAALIAANAFAGADSVVVTRSDTFADALSGSFLAGAYGGPILLTPPNELSATTTAEIVRQFDLADANLRSGEARTDKTIYILGGTAAVSAGVETALASLDYDGTVDIVRLGGSDRYATNRQIIEQVDESDVGTLGTSGRTALITRGDTFPDALSVGPVSYQASFPVVLTRTSQLEDETLELLDDLDVGYALVVGGAAAVSEDVRAQLDTLDVGMQRLAGPNRQATSVAVADFSRSQLGFSQTTVAIGNSQNFPDALAGGPLGGRAEAPILMVNDPSSVGDEVSGYLIDQADRIEQVVAVGGAAAVSDVTLAAAACLAQPEADGC